MDLSMTDLPDHECADGTTSQLFSWADFDFEPLVKAANVSLRSASTIRPSKRHWLRRRNAELVTLH